MGRKDVRIVHIGRKSRRRRRGGRATSKRSLSVVGGRRGRRRRRRRSTARVRVVGRLVGRVGGHAVQALLPSPSLLHHVAPLLSSFPPGPAPLSTPSLPVAWPLPPPEGRGVSPSFPSPSSSPPSSFSTSSFPPSSSSSSGCCCCYW